MSEKKNLQSFFKTRLEEIEEVIKKALRQASRSRSSLTILPATKGQTIHSIKALYDLGFRAFGENRLQDAKSKIQELPQDIFWHFIGTLQRNKVEPAIKNFQCIQSVDRLELAEKLSFKALEHQISLPIFLEVNASEEVTKHGFSFDTLERAFHQIQELPSLKIAGLMTLGPKTQDEAAIRKCFSRMKKLYDHLQASTSSEMIHLSMGMSDDYAIAIEEGSTMIRLGRTLFQDA